MIRVVIDTNIIVSALLQPLGPPAQVFLLAVSGSISRMNVGRPFRFSLPSSLKSILASGVLATQAPPFQIRKAPIV